CRHRRRATVRAARETQGEMDRANDSTCDLPRRMGASRTAPAAPYRPASGPCYRTPGPTVERWAERTVLTSHSGNARRGFFHALTLKCHARAATRCTRLRTSSDPANRDYGLHAP